MNINTLSEPLSAHITKDNDFNDLTYVIEKQTETIDTTLFDPYGIVIGTAIDRNSVTHFSTGTVGSQFRDLSGTGFWEALYKCFQKTREYVHILPDIQSSAEHLSRNDIEVLLLENTSTLIETLNDIALTEWKVELIKAILSQYAVAFARYGNGWGVENDRLAVLIGKAWFESTHSNESLPEGVHKALTQYAINEPVETAFTGYDSVTIWTEE